MINLKGLVNMVIFKGKDRRDADAVALQAQTYKRLTIGELSNDTDTEWGDAKFWVVIDNNLVDVHGVTYTGLVLPNGVAQWAIFANIHGVICHMGYVWDDTSIFVTYAEFKPIKGAWAIYQEMAS